MGDGDFTGAGYLGVGAVAGRVVFFCISVLLIVTARIGGGSSDLLLL